MHHRNAFRAASVPPAEVQPDEEYKRSTLIVRTGPRRRHVRDYVGN
jgi:hypothetical protein